MIIRYVFSNVIVELYTCDYRCISFFLQRKFCLQDPCFDFVCPCLFSSTPMVTLFLWFRQRLLRALEARRVMLQKEQGMAFARAFAAGFSLENIGDLVLFSECFGAARLR